MSCRCYVKQVFLLKNYSLLLGLQPSLLLKYLYFEKSQEAFIKNIGMLGQDLFVTYKIHKSPETVTKVETVFSLKKMQKAKAFYSSP